MKKPNSKILYALLFPPVAVLLLLILASTVALSLVFKWLTPSHALSILAYILACYTLTLICLRVPDVITWARRVSRDNKYLRAYLSDPRIRVKISLYGSLVFNGAYALLQFFLGLWHASVWYYSLAAYYVLLAVMRLMLLGHTRAHAPGERYKAELSRYRATGILLLVLNVALTSIIAFQVLQNKTIRHHEITVIAMAAYTFTAFTLAITNMVKYRKYNSPVFSAVKAIGLVAATVSMLSLESSMLITFGEAETGEFNRIMLAASGAAVAATVLSLSIYMIVTGTRKLKAETDSKGEINNGD